ncbi:glycosyltransferase family 2 protein [Desulfamplus magnetovallimortis]|nr:glycosyltransferase [Desulfamplus magnetovallimortis]
MNKELLDILNILTLIHFASMGGLALYGTHRIWLLICWFKSRSEEKHETRLSFDKLPLVTIQVPLYNEPLVAARIIDAVASIQWQSNKLEIQILDDSSDETNDIVKESVKYWAGQGVWIYAIFRNNRKGYKAGALQNGLRQSSGEFIAVFDADFIPPTDFLKKTIPHFYPIDLNQDLTDQNKISRKRNKIIKNKNFINSNTKDKKIGMVQTRWGFLNSRYSWLTRLQTLMLSPHFGIEHKIRFSRHLFFNFNGTAGVWRKEAIESSGGWQDDTVTEDLDLSYRAQLSGWKFLYLNDVVVPSELPATLSDFRSQQERWSKGSIQTARKILPGLLSSPVSLGVKIEAIAHLMANVCWLLGFIVTMTLYPVILYRSSIGICQVKWIEIPLLCISFSILTYYLVYSIFNRQYYVLTALPLLPIISIALSPFFALSVVKGAFEKGGVFVRTPKFGFSDSSKRDYTCDLQ